MAEFSIWHVLPPGTMPTVRQVLECGGGTWMFIRYGIRVFVSIDVDGMPCYRTKDGGETYNESPFAEIMGVTTPRPIEALMPTPAEVGAESRWVVLSMHGPMRRGVDVWRMPCTLRNDQGVVEVKWDDHGEWQYFAPFWGAGMVAVKESSCTSA